MLYSRARAPEQLQGGVAAVNVKIDIGVSPEQLQGGVAAVNVRILESHRSSSRAANRFEFVYFLICILAGLSKNRVPEQLQGGVAAHGAGDAQPLRDQHLLHHQLCQHRRGTRQRDTRRRFDCAPWRRQRGMR